MKKRHKYLNPVVLYLCVYLFGLWIYAAGRGAVNWTYTYLNHLMPGIFPVYQRIYEPEAYARLEQIKSLVGIFVALLLINLIALKLDNKKYERISLLTGGEYLIKDGLKVYFKEFFVIDVIVSTVLPALLVIPAYFLSEDALGYFGLIFWNWLGYNIKSLFDLFPAMLIAATFSFCARMLIIPHCIKAWRAAWLTDI